MSRVFLSSWGAVSPKGLSAGDLSRSSIETPVPVRAPDARGREHHAHAVPPPQERFDWMAHPRLRRASAISRHLVAAASQAIQGAPPDPETLGVLFTVLSGSVTYSRRFFEEVLRDPRTASPLLFPETVFNAPASHLAAFLGARGVNYTLVGDTTGFARSVALAASMIRAGTIQSCLVAASEEMDWITCEALHCFGRDPLAEGAGALLLSRDPGGRRVELLAVSDEHFGPAAEEAALNDLIKAGFHDLETVQEPTPGMEGLMAGAAWQWIAAAEALQNGRKRTAMIPTRGLLGSSIAGVLGLAG